MTKKYVLDLYIAGLTPRSQIAIRNVKGICQKYIKNNCALKIHDIYKEPLIAKDVQILAAPTLIKQFPLPLRKFVGDMSNMDKLLTGLGLESS